MVKLGILAGLRLACAWRNEAPPTTLAAYNIIYVHKVMIPRQKLSDYVYRFRVVASRHSFTLIYVWAGVFLAGLGMLQYKYMIGGKVQCMLIVYNTRVRCSPDNAFSDLLHICVYRHIGRYATKS